MRLLNSIFVWYTLTFCTSSAVGAWIRTHAKRKRRKELHLFPNPTTPFFPCIFLPMTSPQSAISHTTSSPKLSYLSSILPSQANTQQYNLSISTSPKYPPSISPSHIQTTHLLASLLTSQQNLNQPSRQGAKTQGKEI